MAECTADSGSELEPRESCVAEDDLEEFVDAFDSMEAVHDELDSEVQFTPSSSVTELELPAAIAEAIVAMDLFFNNRFAESKIIYQKRADRSMYHALGYATVMYLQAAMTFEPADIEAATDVVKASLNVCSRHRRRASMLRQFYRRQEFADELTVEEVHAEVCYAECLLERAILNFIRDENLIGFIKGSLKIRECYSLYKRSMHILKSRSWKDGDEKIHFESGVHLGIGMFNLMISQLPARILKLLEFIGFSGNRRYGMSELELGAGLHKAMRAPLCALTLITYHSHVTFMFGTGDGNLEFASQLLRQCLVRYPHAALFLFLEARLLQVNGKLDEAIAKFEQSIESQQEWKQFHHMCYWELMWCYCFKADWLFAMKYAERLFSESRWSRSTYACLKASFLLMTDDVSTCDHVTFLMQQVPLLKQRIAGKSLPVEKFAVKKSARYFEQNHRLTLPAYEMMYAWNYFTVIASTEHLLDLVLDRIQATVAELTELEQCNQHHRRYFFDDLCLAMLIKGVCLRHKHNVDEALHCFQFIVTHEKDIEDDHYLVPSALYEAAMVHLYSGQHTQAKDLLTHAKDHHKHYSLESRLHFRIHAANTKLKQLTSTSSQSVSSQY